MPPQLVIGKALVPSHSVVDTAEERTYFWQSLMRLWKVPKRKAGYATFSPSCNPVSLSRAALPTLRENPYLIALKSDGVRYTLFLTLRPDGVSPVALMVDRARTMHEVEMLAPEAYFREGTVLEGELVWEQPMQTRMVFHVFDAVCVKGECLLSHPFEARLAAATRCVKWSEELASAADDIESRVIETDSMCLVHFDPILGLKPKRFVDRVHAPRLWAERGEAEHRVDGIVLQRADVPYTMGTADDGSVFKWKEHSTIDLTGPSDDLRAADGPLTSHVGTRRVEVVPSRVIGAKGVVTEYHVAVDDARVVLFATRHRTDKGDANGLRVVHATVRDVVDALTPEEIAG